MTGKPTRPLEARALPYVSEALIARICELSVIVRELRAGHDRRLDAWGMPPLERAKACVVDSSKMSPLAHRTFRALGIPEIDDPEGASRGQANRRRRRNAGVYGGQMGGKQGAQEASLGVSEGVISDVQQPVQSGGSSAETRGEVQVQPVADPTAPEGPEPPA